MKAVAKFKWAGLVLAILVTGMIIGCQSEPVVVEKIVVKEVPVEKVVVKEVPVEVVVTATPVPPPTRMPVASTATARPTATPVVVNTASSKVVVAAINRENYVTLEGQIIDYYFSDHEDASFAGGNRSSAVKHLDDFVGFLLSSTLYNG